MSQPHLIVVGNAASLAAIVLSWTGVLQPLVALIATLVAGVWYSVQVWESHTIQKRLRAHRIRRHRRRRNKGNPPQGVIHV